MVEKGRHSTAIHAQWVVESEVTKVAYQPRSNRLRMVIALAFLPGVILPFLNFNNVNCAAVDFFDLTESLLIGKWHDWQWVAILDLGFIFPLLLAPWLIRLAINRHIQQAEATVVSVASILVLLLTSFYHVFVIGEVVEGNAPIDRFRISDIWILGLAPLILIIVLLILALRMKRLLYLERYKIPLILGYLAFITNSIVIAVSSIKSINFCTIMVGWLILVAGVDLYLISNEKTIKSILE